MNPKDKAIEIMSMYRPIINNSMSKECAIIHVKGIIEVLNKGSMRVNLRSQTPEYWQEVLTELIKM